MSHFDTAKMAALMRDLVAFLAGRPSRLLPFDEVRESLKLRHLVDRGTYEVPLEKIVGTLGLGRAKEFNRAFLPRREALRDRWEAVEQLVEGPAGFPPVDLYKVSDAYFVIDGHHRISVLRSIGAQTVDARVKEFITPVPLAPGDSIDEVIHKRGLADFLESTGLAPEADDDLRVTVPDAYSRLLEHISVHRYFMGIEAGYPIAWKDAVGSWYTSIYRPVVEKIRSSGVLSDGRLEGFDRRTETDLYLFTMDHLHQLRKRYPAEQVPPDQALEDFAATHRSQPGPVRSLIRRLRGSGHRDADGEDETTNSAEDSGSANDEESGE